MRLLLAEQVLLLALDDEKGTDRSQWAGEAGLAGALLLDLGERDLLRTDTDRRLVAVDGDPPDHEVLRRAYEVVAGSSRRRGAKAWVDRLQTELKPLRTTLAQGLVDRGVLSEERSRVFGLFPRTRYPEADAHPEFELRQQLFEVLVTGRTPTEEEALLVGLLEPLGLIPQIVPKDHRRAARRRAQEIGEHGLAGSAVRDAVREVQAAVMTAAIVASTTASTTAATS
ncbi:MAG: GPP34 family phosphoprotein [Kineosporiaceae bacterium]